MNFYAKLHFYPLMYIIHSGVIKSGVHIDHKIKIDTTNDVDVVGL